MSAVRWLVYVLSFLVPPFGFVTFWVLIGKQEEELKRVARMSLIASFIGAIVGIILIAVGIRIGVFGMGMGLLK